MLNLDSSPFSLGAFSFGSNGNINIGDYNFNFGYYSITDSEVKYFVSVRKAFYPYTNVFNSSNLNTAFHSIYSCTFKIEGKSFYIFLNPNESFISENNYLPVDLIFGGVNGNGIPQGSTNITLQKNLESLYGILSESGAFFDKDLAYREKALVRSAINGFLYQSKNTIPNDGTIELIDPSIDSINWRLYTAGILNSLNLSFSPESFVDKTSNQNIDGIKTFLKPVNAPMAINNDHLITLGQSTNLFLGKTNKASDSFLLNGFSTSSISSPLVIPVTDPSGRLHKTFFPFDVINNIETYLVTEDASIPNSFRSLQSVWDYLKNKLILFPLTIKIADGTYTNGITIPDTLNFLDGVVYTKMISIIGNINYPNLVVIESETNQTNVEFIGEGLQVDGITIRNSKKNKTGIGIKTSENSRLILGSSVIIEGFDIGLLVEKNSYCFAENLIVKSCNIGIKADAGVIDNDNSFFYESEFAVLATNRSVIFSNNSEINGTCDNGFKANKISLIEANNTENKNHARCEKYINDISSIIEKGI